jgi:hypothetical protein
VGLSRAALWFLAIVGALSLLLALVNYATLRGIFRINSVTRGVSWADVYIQLNSTGLKERRMTPEKARATLQSGLRSLGLSATVRLRR